MLAIHRPDTFVTRPVYVAALRAPAKPAGGRPARPAAVRDARSRERVEVPADRWVTVAGTAFVLGVAVDAGDSHLLVDFGNETLVWVEERDAIRPAAISKRPSTRTAS
jgi:hypothetical protein